MSTVYPADPCMKPHTVDDTIRERLMSVLLRKTLPILWREELSTRTNADLRQLIGEIEQVTGTKELPPIRYQPDDYDLVELDSDHWEMR